MWIKCMYHYERAIIMTIKFALLLSVSAGGLIVLLSKTADADLKSPLFEDIIPLSGSRYANVCFITDSEDCRGNEFETFEKPIMPALCTPLEDETDCDYGRELADNGCGGMRYVCKSCIPLSDESGCDYGTTTASDGCGGTRTVCKECVPLADQTDCEFGTTTVDDGCGGTRRICKNCTPLESDDPANCEHGVENVDDGCGGTRTICKGCTPQTGDDPESCEHGFEVVDDGCGGTVIKCNGCSPKPDVSPSDCICGVENEDDGCGGTHMVCKAGDNNCQGQETPCAEDMVQETCTDCLGKTFYKCYDPEDTEKACPQKVYCDPETKIGVEPSCTDSNGKIFHEKCLAKEICKPDSEYVNYYQYSAVGEDIFHLDMAGLYISNPATDKNFADKLKSIEALPEEERKSQLAELEAQYSQMNDLEYYKDKCTTQAGTVYKYYGQCSPGYKLADGTKSRCFDYKYCGGDVYGDGKTCICGGKTYYENCKTDTCYDGIINVPGKGTCEGFVETSAFHYQHLDEGYYLVGEKCTTLTGKEINNYWKCNETSPDCEGNMPPCAGYKDCEGYTSGSGKTCTCGDKTYYESCGGEQCDVALEGCSITSSHWQNTGHYLVKEGCGGYRYYASCNAKSPDCDGVMPPCAGKKICLSHQKGVGTACSCGGKTYYDSCESEDVCTKSADTEWEDSTIFTTGGEYKVREYCTDPDTNRTLYYHAACNHTKTDLSGNTAPCAGYFEGCETGLMASGKTCTCGGKTYYENCLKECNYEDTEESCRSQGLGFERKCYGSRDGKTQIWYGECK